MLLLENWRAVAEALMNDAQRWPKSAEAGIAHRAVGIPLLCWTRWWAGEQDDEAGMREGLALLGDIGQRLDVPSCKMGLAEVEAQSGRVDAGLATVDARLAMIEQTGERSFDDLIVSRGRER